MSSAHVPADQRRDVAVFLGRIVRLDPGALVRVRPAGASHLTLWAQLPFDVLAARTVAGTWPDDVTLGASALLEAVPVGAGGTVTLPRRRDADWRGSLPPDRGWHPLDTVPVDVVRGLIAAGQEAFQRNPEAGELLLDHETLRVVGDVHETTVPFRLLVALARMAFLGERDVTVAVVGPWLRLAAEHGIVYRRKPLASVATL
ncbi:hypothetical protein [Cryptosporangium sp. NPDC051539]|uniref:hypothetical protein n=1 Tax=Cryptosporangium sp. NPDC051539 TaxID=3363962 RepID=UPI003795D739